MRPSATGDLQHVRSSLDRIAVLFALFLVLGPLIVARIGQPGVLHIGTGISTFFVQYRLHEPIFLALLAAFLVLAAVMARRQAPDDTHDSSSWRLLSRPHATWLAGVSVIVLAATAIGTWRVMHALPFSMDEYVAAFQSRVLASGATTSVLPDQWKPFGRALAPVFVALDPDRGLWTAQYLPLYAALRAPFVASGADRLVNPVLAALSVSLVYACACRLWPTQRHRAWLAVAFLASSSQFLFMSMTGYAMPAHLAVNLLWLYAYLRNDRAGWIAAPLIGVAALGLHNPFPHALFVAPFLLHVLLQRKWGWTAYFAAVYFAGITVWYSWSRSVGMGGAGANPAGVFELPGLMVAGVQHLSLTLIFSWQTPLLALALAWTVVAWRSLSATERLLAPSIILSFAFFFLFPSTQGHGWGYRYTYPVLGNLVLLGAVGADTLANALGRVVVRRMLLASLLLTVAVQWPVRAWQIERYVRPFALAHEYVSTIDADVVIVDPTTSWYGIDLVRNDPFLRDTPKVLSAFYLRPGDKQLLAARFGERVHMLQPEELGRFGIPVFPSRFKRPVWP